MYYNLEELRKDLYIEDEEYDEDFQAHIETFKKVVEEINKDNELIPVFESDLEFEKDYLEEYNKDMKVIKNINGVVLYKTTPFKNVVLTELQLDRVYNVLNFEEHETIVSGEYNYITKNLTIEYTSLEDGEEHVFIYETELDEEYINYILKGTR